MVVPRDAAIGDEVVINVAGSGLFATGRIASQTRPRTDWPNRYGAALDSIELMTPPISLGDVQRRIPELKWARYPRSITTPSPELAEKIRDLLNRVTDLDTASPEALARIASKDLPDDPTPKQRVINQYVRSAQVRLQVLQRANGVCEGCGDPAPFLTFAGLPFLETHHVKRRAKGGRDHYSNVIALCPNCHRRTDFAKDAKSFNASLLARLATLEKGYRKA